MGVPEFPGPRPNGEDNAVIFLNDPDRQGRGEATAALRSDGSVGLFYLVPGSLGTNPNPTWQCQEFPGPNGAKDAVIFLNEPDRQGHGEASVSLRGDGTAGLLYLEPGSLGTSTTHTWEYGEFVGPKQAVDFLNDPARQGAGEATVTPRKNGTVGLVYLVPGSLDDSTTQTWCYKEFHAPHGVGRPGVPECPSPAGGRRSQRIRPLRRVRRDLLSRARLELIAFGRSGPKQTPRCRQAPGRHHARPGRIIRPPR